MGDWHILYEYEIISDFVIIESVFHLKYATRLRTRGSKGVRNCSPGS